MRTTRFTAAVLAVLVTFTLLSACTFEQEAPIDAVEISAEETQLITTLKAEGKDELEIAEEDNISELRSTRADRSEMCQKLEKIQKEVQTLIERIHGIA